MPRLTLIGFRGTGKTTVAAALASRFACGWEDADVVFEQRAGCSVADFFARHGEPAFRDRETELLSELLGTCEGVLATGGGVVLREANRALLSARGRPVVWLDASVDAVRARLSSDPTTAARRPALTGGDPFAEVERLMSERHPLYASVADFRVDTSSMESEAVVEKIAGWIASWLPGQADTDGGR